MKLRWWLPGLMLVLLWGVSAAQAQRRGWKPICLEYKKGALLVDVRTLREVKATPVKGATHIPLSVIQRNPLVIKAWLKKQKKSKTPIIFFCHSGGRSGLAVMMVKAVGLKKVYNGGEYTIWQKIKPRKQLVCKDNP